MKERGVPELNYRAIAGSISRESRRKPPSSSCVEKLSRGLGATTCRRDLACREISTQSRSQTGFICLAITSTWLSGTFFAKRTIALPSLRPLLQAPAANPSCQSEKQSGGTVHGDYYRQQERETGTGNKWDRLPIASPLGSAFWQTCSAEYSCRAWASLAQGEIPLDSAGSRNVKGRRTEAPQES